MRSKGKADKASAVGGLYAPLPHARQQTVRHSRYAFLRGCNNCVSSSPQSCRNWAETGPKRFKSAIRARV